MAPNEIILFGAFAGLLLLGVPFAFAIGVAVAAALMSSGLSIAVLPQQLISGISVYSLLSIPCSILAGDLMFAGGLSRRLVNLAMVLLGRQPGGAAIVAITSATAFGAITGSANATTAAIGRATIPEMVKRGYSVEFSAALAATYGPIGILLPPSIPLIVWGVIANQSISKLFVAGILPALLITLGLSFGAYLHAIRHRIPVDRERFSWQRLLESLNEAKWAVLAPIIILGGIYGGIFTPTEAGAVGSLYGCIVGLSNGEIKVGQLPRILFRSMRTAAMILYIVGMSASFSWIMGYDQLPDRLGNALLGVSARPIVILLLVNILLIVIGSFMDELAALIILSTFLIHVGHSLGVDPIHLGVIVVTNLAVELTHPPMGYTLLTASAVSGVPTEKMIKPLVPLVAIELLVLLVVTYFPGVSLSLSKFL